MAMMATLKVSLRGTPYEWYFKAKELVSFGDLNEKEVYKAIDALIRLAKKRTGGITDYELTSCWSDVCYCMIHGYLNNREAIEILKPLVEMKKYCSYSDLKPTVETPVIPMTTEHGGMDVKQPSEEACPMVQAKKL